MKQAGQARLIRFVAMLTEYGAQQASGLPWETVAATTEPPGRLKHSLGQQFVNRHLLIVADARSNACGEHQIEIVWEALLHEKVSMVPCLPKHR